MIKQTLEFIRFITGRMGKKQRRLFYGVAGLALLYNLLLLALPLLQKSILDSIVISVFNNELVLLFLACGLLVTIVSVGEALILNSLDIFLQNHLQKELLESAIRQKNKTIDLRGAGAYMVNVFGDSEQISSLININFYSIVAMVLLCIGVFIIGTVWSWLFAAIVLPAYLLITLVMVVTNRIYSRQFTQARERVYEVNPKVLELLENRNSVLGYSDVSNLENDLYAIFACRDGHFKNANAASVFAKTAIEAIKTIALVLFFAFAVLEILANRMPVSTFIALTAYFSVIFSPVAAIQTLNSGMNRFRMLKGKIADSLQLQPRLLAPNDQSLRIEGCYFSYKDNDGTKNINNLSLKVDKNIGLVGLSGEGKTTIIKIVLGELEPSAGQCLLGSKPVSNMSKALVFSSVRLYSQDPELFDKDLCFNITLGKAPLPRAEYGNKLSVLQDTVHSCFCKIEDSAGKKLDSAEVGVIRDIFLLNENQLQDDAILGAIGQNYNSLAENERYRLISVLASILTSRKYYIGERYKEIVSALGIEYLKGRDFGQRGNKISGGEKNKVCLARFLLPEHKGYYILDEPFASLDLLAENQCLDILAKYISEFMGGLIISHKLNVLKRLADELVVLESGSVTEQGSHNSLLKNKGLYARLYQEYLAEKES